VEQDGGEALDRLEDIELALLRVNAQLLFLFLFLILLVLLALLVFA